MHILLIEDDLDLGRALQAALRLEGHSSEWLRRAADAPLRLDDAAQDAVLLDQTLPDGDGHALLPRWRRQGSRVPVIVITARTALSDRLAGFDGGADDYVLKPFELPELIARLRSVLRRSAQQASDHWQLGALSIDRAAFQSVLQNLLDNALRYVPQGGQVEVGLQQDGQGLRLSVADDGPGIAAADREQVFQRFWRGKGHEQPGTGLGLAIVHQAAQRLGGQVSLREGLDRRGSRFELQLPSSALGIS